MKLVEIGTTVGAVLLVQASIVHAKNTHLHGHHHHVKSHDRRHVHHVRDINATTIVEDQLELRDVEVKRQTQCQFPTNLGLVPITPDQQNAGWAMSPNQPCTSGTWCPYACPPGQWTAQWDPAATSYSYPISMNGGLYCDENGNVQKPFSSQPYCMEGTGTVSAVNLAGETVAFCQTVLPGSESMLIPTEVNDAPVVLNVPGPDYWLSTAAQFYVNTPGLSTDTACIWGTNANPWGNWAPYTVGHNTDAAGHTYVKLGWNPIWLEPTTSFRNVMPEFGIKIECVGTCNGGTCAIDPATNGVNEMTGTTVSVGAGGATFCILTMEPGSTANYVVFKGALADVGSTPQGGSQAQAAIPPTTAAAASTAPASTLTPPSSSAPLSITTPKGTPSTAPTSSPVAVSSINSTSTFVPSESNAPHVLLEGSNATISTYSVSTVVGPVMTAPANPTEGSTGTTAGTAAASPSQTGSSIRLHATAAGLGLSLLAAIMVIAL